MILWVQVMRAGGPIVVVVALSASIVACGGGDITSGFDLDFTPDFCEKGSGEFRGEVQSESGNPGNTILVTLKWDGDCKAKGSVAFPPCVPHAGVRGTAGSTLSAEPIQIIETVTSSPSLRIEQINDPDFQRDPERPFMPLFPPQIHVYTLTTDGANGCPVNDSGRVELVRVGG